MPASNPPLKPAPVARPHSLLQQFLLRGHRDEPVPTWIIFPVIYAFVLLTRDRALADAHRADSELQASIDRGPFHGIPYALKDIYDTGGIRTTCHSKLRLNNVPAADSVVADMELHYALGKGNTAMYAYLIARHPASYAVYTNDLNISFIQSIWPTAHDNTNFLCEDQYVDDNVKYGLQTNGVYQTRAGLQPNFFDKG